MLRIRNLKAGYDGKAVVDIAALDVARGEHCLILGPSGSGKTTLLYAIAGLLRPLAGEIYVAGTSMTALDAAARDAFRGRHFGIIYQTLHMVEALSVRENILLAPYAAGLTQDRARADDLLQQMGLFELRDRKPAQLSQGQRQRVAMARAAITSPTVIIGDEPTSALDDGACEVVMRTLLDTASAVGANLVVATHDARIQRYFRQRVVLGGAV